MFAVVLIENKDYKYTLTRMLVRNKEAKKRSHTCFSRTRNSQHTITRLLIRTFRGYIEAVGGPVVITFPVAKHYTCPNVIKI